MNKIYILMCLIFFQCFACASETILANDKPINELSDAIQKGRIEIVEEYIDKGAIKNSSINSLYIFYAVIKKRSEIVKLLLNEGVSPNSEYSHTPVIFFAIHNKDAQILNILLSAGADPNKDILPPYSGTKNMSPLTYSIIRKDTISSKILINYGANINKIAYGELPIATAIKEKQIDIIKLLLKEGAIVDDYAKKLLKRAKPEIKELFN